MGTELIYLACPFSHPDPEVKKKRFEIATKIAARYFSKGIHVFSPLTHCYPIEQVPETKLPGDWAFWAEYDERILSICDRVVVIAIDGWTASTGVQAEITIARRLGKPVDYLTPAES